MSSWEAAAVIPGSPTRGVVVRSGETAHGIFQSSSDLLLGQDREEEGEGLVSLLVGLFQPSPIKTVY